MFQPPSFDLEISRAQGTTATAQDSTLVAPDPQECLSSDEVDLVRTFLELLAKWEEQERRGN